jgi:hypothetical protein
VDPFFRYLDFAARATFLVSTDARALVCDFGTFDCTLQPLSVSLASTRLLRRTKHISSLFYHLSCPSFRFSAFHPGWIRYGDPASWVECSYNHLCDALCDILHRKQINRGDFETRSRPDRNAGRLSRASRMDRKLSDPRSVHRGKLRPPSENRSDHARQ